MLAIFAVCLLSLVGSSLSLPMRPRHGTGSGHRRSGRLVVFGDSYSDNGTGAWTITNHTWPADPAYDGHRFSNGPVWVEDVAARLSMDLADNAIGGATSNNSATQGFTGKGSTVPVPSVLDQAAAYLNSSEIDSSDLFVILVGANDAFFNGHVEPVILAVQDLVHRLRDRGATQFLLGSYPDLAKLPLRAFSTPAATEALQTFSDALQASLVNLWNQLCDSDLDVGFVDAHTLFNDMMSHPTVYGIDPATMYKSCLVGVYGEAPPTLCSNPDQYIFWDEYHLTRASHQYVADLAVNASRDLCNGIVEY